MEWSARIGRETGGGRRNDSVRGLTPARAGSVAVTFVAVYFFVPGRIPRAVENTIHNTIKMKYTQILIMIIVIIIIMITITVTINIIIIISITIVTMLGSTTTKTTLKKCIFLEAGAGTIKRTTDATQH